MGYWMHVYSRSDKVIPRKNIEEMFEEADIVLEWGTARKGGDWKELSLSHSDEQPIAHVLTDPVSGDRSWASEMEATIEQARDSEPEANGRWVAEFLAGVKTLYSFQILSGVDEDDGWDHVHALQDHLCESYQGIIYAEGEGFSNDNGAHVTWDFSDGASGERVMALFDPRSGTWTSFSMKLGNRQHREAFRAGRLPKGVKPLPEGMSFWA